MAEEIDILFKDAVEALRAGDRPRAKELLTRLLKADQHNANYWVWMSAAVETAKERVYCLQTALQIDPENKNAKRGLVLLGALPPDETTPPFPVNHPRSWEKELILSYEQPLEKIPFLSRPLTRLAGMGAAILALVGLSIFMLLQPRNSRAVRLPTHTFGPSPTFTSTPTALGEKPRPTPTHVGPTPLWASLPATYTPTPLYAPTPRQPQSGDIFRAASEAYARGNWSDFINFMQQVTAAEPEAADPWYFIGEAYRFQGKYTEALDSYNRALALNPDFGPAYLGRARVNLALDPASKVMDDLDAALKHDPGFAEAWIVRAAYKTDHNDAKGALKDLKSAEALTPDSPLLYYEYARAHYVLGEADRALEFAQRANELDITLVPVYLLLGELYAETGQPEESYKAIQTYVAYAEENQTTLYLQGKLLFLQKDYEAALEKLDAALKLGNMDEARLYRGLIYIHLNRPPEAVYELRVAAQAMPDSFEASIGLAQAYLLNKTPGNSYQTAEKAFSLAADDGQRVQVYYWRAKAQDALGQYAGSRRDWEALLALPPEVVPAAWRTEARARVDALSTPTRTPTVTLTPRPGTKTPTPKPATPTP